MTGLSSVALQEAVDRLYIVNLPSRSDRLAEMVLELDRIGLTLDSPVVEVFAAIKPEAAGSFPSIGARGCFLSHLGILRDAAAKGLQTVMILEDDAAFTADCRAQLAEVLQDLKSADWALAYLGHRIAPEALAAADASASAHWRVLSPQTGVETTHAMLIHKPALAPLITYLERMMARPAGHPEGGPMHVDGAYSWFRRDHPDLRTLVTPRQYVLQRASKSDIARPIWKDRLPFLPALRRLKNYLSQHR